MGGLIPAGEVDGHLRIGGGIDLFPSDSSWWVEDTDRGRGDRELQATPPFGQWGAVTSARPETILIILNNMLP